MYIDFCFIYKDFYLRNLRKVILKKTLSSEYFSRKTYFLNNQ